MPATQKSNYVFGLDIGTRSIVGTVGYKEKDRFIVICQRVMEHETRSMLDGQIHDIGRVAETIKIVKEQCEEAIGQPLKQVCIAAAGRVLQTLDTHIDMVFEDERETTQEDVTNLMSLGVEKAYREFVPNTNTDVKFYCVGYSVVRYYLNKYQIGNLVGHKAKQISADIIATFLPDDVVDGLYRAVELAGLEVSNLTLEPIAAITVAIPEKFRMLNIGLVDVGAGTSDISITKDGSIIAYGMIPMAGDAFTEEIALHCLVDFDMAEKIKRDSTVMDTIQYEDIMGLTQTITAAEVSEVVEGKLEEITGKVADEIMRLNGGKPVSAVFVVGGGGIITGFTEKLATKLSIPKERVALRGGEVMSKITFIEPDSLKTSLMVTPIGICLNYFESTNNLMYVSFNGKRIKMYDNGHINVIDVAVAAGFPNDGLFPKRGKAVTYSVNGKSKIAKGEVGEAAVITVNGEPADITRKINCNDKISIQESTKGVRARIRISSLPEFVKDITLNIEGKDLKLPRPVFVNGALTGSDYEIMDDDIVEIADYCMLDQLRAALDLSEDKVIIVNGKKADSDTKIYEKFSVNIVGIEESLSFDLKEESEAVKDTIEEPAKESVSKPNKIGVTVIVNKKPIFLTGKDEFVFVDVFDYIDFDLSKPNGKDVVTLHNGKEAGYMDPIFEGDNIEVYWKE